MAASTANLVSPVTASAARNQRNNRLFPSPLIPSSAVNRHQLSSAFLSGIKLEISIRNPNRCRAQRISKCRAALEALVFDCDGVILESEDLHRRAYNATFSNFNVLCPGSDKPLDWNVEFYDQLQNQIGGGKPKMRWYFKTYGWPTSTVFATAPESDADRESLIDTLQDWKTEKYKDLIASGAVEPRPGVLELMDEARAKGLKVAVCSAATKSSVVFCLTNLLGKDRFEQLDCFMAGDDVQKKKPDPSIYIEASKRLGIPADRCLVVEDSVIGLQAALGAGMKCIISYTSSTAEQDFSGASAIYPDLGNVRLQNLQDLMQAISVI